MFRRLCKKGSRSTRSIDPDEIFLDASNLPEYDAGQFGGRVERPVGFRAMFTVGAVFVLVATGFGYRAFSLQVSNGQSYRTISEENTLDHSLIFATRGIIYDRNNVELAWNEAQIATSTENVPLAQTYALRKYASMPGSSNLLGFLQYPKADAKGAWWRSEYTGVSGIELSFDATLRGKNGSTMIETNARGHIQRENIVLPPHRGEDVTLSIDSDVQSKLYTVLSAHAERMKFQGGAAVIMNVRTGELLAITSFPEYDNQAFTDGNSSIIKTQSQSTKSPLLNRAIGGVYAPGSIVKPIFAAAALTEKIISPDKQILSKGAITLPNPYDPTNPSVFRDWKVHGWVDMRTAIAVSSDEYFYTIGGGYGSQKGLGIAKLDEYARDFGLAKVTGIQLSGEKAGVVPTPEWKAKNFDGDEWRIGNTYHTAIGQYGFQLTPIQAVRFTAAIANGGSLLTPHLVASSSAERIPVGVSDIDLKIVREGMRLAVTSNRDDATVKSLYIAGISIAGKTGTAQLGYHNESMNSWAIGFWPSENPIYAFAVVLEKAPAGTLSGAAPGLVPFFQWLIANKPQYIQ